MPPPAPLPGVRAEGWKEDRLTDERPRSARFVPEEERWNIGWLGRADDKASDCLDPDIDLTWLFEKGGGAPPALELDRFIAEAGWGSAEL
jgi:hypothetical protein